MCVDITERIDTGRIVLDLAEIDSDTGPIHPSHANRFRYGSRYGKPWSDGHFDVVLMCMDMSDWFVDAVVDLDFVLDFSIPCLVSRQRNDSGQGSSRHLERTKCGEGNRYWVHTRPGSRFAVEDASLERAEKGESIL
ncbi:hypothetical protein AKJ16_DCAP07154 [Drosera capensis]